MTTTDPFDTYVELWLAAQNVDRLTAQLATARRRINATVRAVQDAQRNGQTVTSNDAILDALEANQ
jgi:hypothetical protein